MSSLSDQVLEIARLKGVIRSADLRQLGASNGYLCWLAGKGLLVRVGRGLYADSTSRMSAHQGIVQVAAQYPNATICLLSALAFHQIGTQMPPAVWMAIGHKDRAPASNSVPIVVVRMTDKLLSAGVDMKLLDGVPIRVTNVAKTLADCFKFRSKVGTDVAIEALKDVLRRKLATSDDLYRYAKLDRVWSIMKPYAEAIS